jgi:hypothetical protein
MTRFDQIPPDQNASIKQVWAVAFKFSKDYQDRFLNVSIKALAVVFRAVILKSYADKDAYITHGEVQDFLSGAKSCPASLLDLIKLEPSQRTSREPKRTPGKKNTKPLTNQPNPILDLMRKDLDKLTEE